ncbi:pentapeptide repeat-containing protein [Dolosigranulum pigrum]|uniref:pentapeptide repeat-containing protein n=1 Tax=Dolosigranulum pigrum TaxID=29394 RepID=UPI001AD87C26|nr:pentapeptide repeat-containing protein [Dolosigranulum pigrum]
MVLFLYVKDVISLGKGYDLKIFVKKRKQKYPRNKFFSYSGVNRDDKNFNYKDFRNSNSIHSSFKRCVFFGTLFKKAKLKYCSFSGAVFTGITFTNCNFKDSRFLGAIFDNCIFENCIFQKCNFKNTKFINTYTRNSSFLGASGLKLDLKKYDINELKFANDSLISDLRLKYKNTNVESLINNIDLSRLLMLVELDRLEQILDILKENEKIQIVTFSHVLSKVR